MPFIFSTATNDTIYTEYEKVGEGGLPTIIRRVVVKGGANLADKKLITPKGVVTNVSDDDIEWLKAHASFQRHVNKGFISVSATKEDPAKVAANMTAKDKAAPTTPETFGEKAPTTGSTTKAK